MYNIEIKYSSLSNKQKNKAVGKILPPIFIIKIYI